MGCHRHRQRHQLLVHAHRRGGARGRIARPLAVDAFGQELFTPVDANGSPAVAVYRLQAPGGQPTAFAIQMLDVVAGRIGAIHAFFDSALLERFGLPADPAS